MRSRRTLRGVSVVPLLVVLSCAATGAAQSGTNGAYPSPAEVTGAGRPEDSQAGISSDDTPVPCTSVAITWPVVGGEPPRLDAPQLAVVRTDFRPKDVQLHLDGRFIGRARYFNGKKGYLFLAPGRYRLEARMGGYRTEVFAIDARPSCRFDIRHRMTRSRGTAKESRGDPPGRGVPSQRVFQPVGEGPPQLKNDRSGGPDIGLRPDLGRPSSPGVSREPPTSSLLVEVRPKTASVYLDGELLATGEELSLMVGPVAIPMGSHVLEIRAPGFVSRKIEIEIERGELKEINVSLESIDDS